MKKLLFVLSLFLVAGFGCAPKEPVAVDSGTDDVPSHETADSIPNVPEPSEESPKPSDGATTPSGSMEMPVITAPSVPIDVSAWSSFTTKTGVSMKYPTKGSYAPTWEYVILKADDAHLKGDCYMADGVMYAMEFSGDILARCQTATAFNAGPGTRVDYVTVKQGSTIGMFVFTKVYPENFSMNDYSLAMQEIIQTIK